MSRFFSNDQEGDGFREHDTEEEARAAAQSALDFATDDGDGWDEDVVSGICWGEIRERAVIKNRRELTEEEKEEHPDWAFYAKVELTVEEVGKTDDEKINSASMHEAWFTPPRRKSP